VGEARKDALVVAVERREQVPAPQPRLVVVQALAKGGRDEDAVEAMTEVGVDEIVPWQAARSVAQWRGEKQAKGVAKWRAVAREAGKQSRRAWLPAVAEPATTREVAERLAAAHVGVVLHEAAGTALASLALPPEGEVVLVVGPEGGLTDGEVETLRASGAQVCRLGDTVLRAGTAGVVAAAVVLAATRWRGPRHSG
jgi:16S rRNA (uracil1498-N3)-methyltransferase